MDKLNLTKLKENYTGLFNFAKGLRNKNMDNDPVFANCPEALKKFATKFSTVVSKLKTSLSFDFLDQQTQLRSMNISSDNNQTLINITDWIVFALKVVILRMEEHGEILTVHTEALPNQ